MTRDSEAARNSDDRRRQRDRVTGTESVRRDEMSLGSDGQCGLECKAREATVMVWPSRSAGPAAPPESVTAD
jgi:hypothetical protein